MMRYEIGIGDKIVCDGRTAGIKTPEIGVVVDIFRSFLLSKMYIVHAPPYNYTFSRKQVEKVTYSSLEELLGITVPNN